MKPKITMLLGHDLLRPRIDPRVFKEAKTLSDHGYEVTIISLSTSTSKSKLKEKIKIIRIPDRAKIGINKKQNIFLVGPKLIANTFSLAKRALQEKSDFIHCHDADTLAAGTLVKLRQRKIKLIYDSHEIATEIIDYRRFRPLIFLIEKVCSYWVDGFITVSYPIKDFITKRFSSFNKHTLVLMNVPLLRKIIPTPTAPAGKIRFVYQGSLMSGRLELLEDFIKTLESFNGWSLTLMVDKKEIPSASILKSHPQVTIKNFIINPAAFFRQLSRFDVGLVPAENNCLNNYYSLPNKLFDYMTAGVAMLAPDFPSLRQVIRETDCGYLGDFQDKNRLSKILKKIFRERKKLQKKKNNGTIWIIKKYHWERQAQKLIQFYAQISAR